MVAELPPRARRIPRVAPIIGELRGTTSACAENTATSGIGDDIPGNYLRVRGEYVAEPVFGGLFLELPPRTRRIQASRPLEGAPYGTTSACAENTLSAMLPYRSRWNYLRVRGEYSRPG